MTEEDFEEMEQKARKNHHIKENAKLTSEVAELKAQIEKMKCCHNCKHNWETKGQCVLNNGGCCICNKWELAK